MGMNMSGAFESKRSRNSKPVDPLKGRFAEHDHDFDQSVGGSTSFTGSEYGCNHDKDSASCFLRQPSARTGM